MICTKCKDDFEKGQMIGNVCRWCEGKKKFAAFAKECGLGRYPDPRGERYVYHVDGKPGGKKAEETDFIDELWNALAKKAGRKDLLI